MVYIWSLFYATLVEWFKLLSCSLVHVYVLPSMWQVHHVGHLDSEDLNLSGNKLRYNKLTYYANSKLAQVHLWM